MSRRLAIQPQADKDLDEIADYIARDNVSAALRFLAAAQMTFEFLVETPLIGVACASFFRADVVRGLRLWRVRGFSNY
ncbi:MAG: type II toxin-antitoxin system RelE/ParE family toxin [Pirellulaceae bacterium]